MNFRDALISMFRPNGKINFLSRLRPGVVILDIGCGNDSPHRIKGVVHDSYYIGIDIGDYNQTKPIVANEYILTTPDGFVETISAFNNNVDVVISSHNLEHCNDRSGTILAMLSALKIGGEIFLSFPSEESVNFPSRIGTLNYFDDPTHKPPPIMFNELCKIIELNGFEITYKNRSYKPFFYRLLGSIMEPFSAAFKRTFVGTWEYYGFESIVIAKKIVR